MASFSIYLPPLGPRQHRSLGGTIEVMKITMEAKLFFGNGLISPIAYCRKFSVDLGSVAQNTTTKV